jgi:hypothetical protein
MLDKLKSKWGITTIPQVVIIFIVFGVTGSVSAAISGPITNYFNISSELLHPLIYWPVRILILFPIYQVLLIWFGLSAGVIVSVFTFQKDKFYFNFFYKMAITMIRKMIKLLSFGVLFKN